MTMIEDPSSMELWIEASPSKQNRLLHLFLSKTFIYHPTYI